MMGRTLRFLIGTALFLIVGTLAALVVAAFWLNTRDGHEFLAEEVSAAISSPAQRITIEDIEGRLPFHIQIGRIEIADGHGPWLKLQKIQLDIDPAGLLQKRLRITRIEAAHLDILRVPQSDTSTPQNSSFTLPRLPIAVTLDTLKIPLLTLGAPLLGETVTLAAKGMASLDAAYGQADIGIDRIDGSAGYAALSVEYGPDRRQIDQLDLALRVEDPSGLVMRATSPAAGRLPLKISLKGLGPLSDWRGHLDATAGTQTSLTAELALGQDRQKITTTLHGTAKLAALLPARFRNVIGNDVGFDLTASLPHRGTARLDGLALTVAAGRLTAAGELGGAADDLKFGLDGNLALAPFSTLSGIKLSGQSEIHAQITGKSHAPRIDLQIAVKELHAATLGAQDASADFSAISEDGHSYTVSAKGFLTGLTRNRAALPATLGDRLDWSGNLLAQLDLASLRLTQGRLEDNGLHLSLTGDYSNGAAQAQFGFKADDLAALASITGQHLKGSMSADGTAHRRADGAVDAIFKAQTASFAIGIPAIDALLGGAVDATAKLQRKADGPFVLSAMTATGRAVKLNGTGRFDAAQNRVSLDSKLLLPRLDVLSQSLGTPISGAASVTSTATGSLHDPSFTADIVADGAKIGATRFDHLAVVAKTVSFARNGMGLDIDLASGPFSEKITTTLLHTNTHVFALQDLALAGSGGQAGGALVLDAASRRITGGITGNAEDLSPWSIFLNDAISGGADFSLRFDPRDGESASLTAHTRDLVFGDPETGVTIADAAVNGDFSDLFSKPRGRLSAILTDTRSGPLSLANSRFNTSSSDGRNFRFDLDVAGKIRENFTLSANGTLSATSPNMVLTLAQLDGQIGSQNLHLEHAATIAKQRAALRLTDLDLVLGNGHLTAAGQGDPITGSFGVKAWGLRLGPLARFAGQDGITGTVTLDASLAGPWRQPRGKAVMHVPDLKLAAADHPELPPLDATVMLKLGNQALAIDGRIETLKHETVMLEGTVPVTITPGARALFETSGALHLSAKGVGRLEDIASILPLGEDRAGGAFRLDLHLDGPIAAPQASGRFDVSGGVYESLSTGISVHDLNLAVEGNQAALELRRLDASDGSGGHLSGSGRVSLDKTGGGLDLKLALKHFAVTRLDEATVIASGDAQITGGLRTPQIAATIGIDRADIQIPDRLPSSVPTVAVIRINSRHPKQAKPRPPIPVIVATLNAKITAPSQIFISGQGLTSEWQAMLSVTGTSQAPNITGQITAVRGTYAVLGKIFTLQQGAIGFPGGGSIDPTLNIQAERVATSITARILIQGTASAPGLTLTSVPQLPQDEILSQVLFGTGVGQISPVQALQLAQTVAAFTGNAPDVMSNVRNIVGLDQLTIDSDTTTSSSASKGVLGGATLNGGKYIAPGVFVGVQKGLTPSATKGEVQVTVSPHVTVDGAIGAGSSSSSLGLTYRLDY